MDVARNFLGDKTRNLGNGSFPAGFCAVGGLRAKPPKS